MNEQLIMQLATGPVAALALCIGAIYFVARWVAQNVPIWIDRHLNQIDNMVESHNEDREVYKDSMTEVNRSLVTLHGDLTVLKGDVSEIKQKIANNPTGQTPVQ